MKNAFAKLPDMNYLQPETPQLQIDPSIYGSDTTVTQPQSAPMPMPPIDTSQFPTMQNLVPKQSLSDLPMLQATKAQHPNGFFNGPQGFLGGLGHIADIIAAIGGAKPGYQPGLEDRISKNAFGALIQNPNDTEAFSTLAQTNPQLAAQVQPMIKSIKDQALTTQAAQMYAKGDATGARNLLLNAGNLTGAKQFSDLNAEDHAQLLDIAQKSVPLIATLKNVPVEQRTQAVAAMAPQFAAHGWDAEHIKQFASGDLSDQGLNNVIQSATTYADYIKQQETAAAVAAKANEPYTLGQGQTRFVGGKEIASVAPEPKYITTPEGSTSTLVNGGATAPVGTGGGHYTGPPLGHQIETTVLSLVPGAKPTSGQRSAAHNAEVGGVANSYHLTDNARDIVPPAGMSMGTFAGIIRAKMPGFDVINEKDHVHIEPGPGMASKAVVGGPPAVIHGAPKPEDAVPTLTHDAIETLAQQVAAGGDIPALGMGKAAAGLKAQIYNRAAEIQKGNGNDGAAMVLVKEGRKANAMALRDLTKRNAVVSAAKNTAISNGDLVVQAAGTGAAGSGSPMINAWQQAYRNNVQGSPDVAKFGLAINTFANEYAKVVSGATGSAGVAEGARQEMLKHLSTASTPQQVSAIIEQAKKEMASSTNALSGQIRNTQDALRNGGKAAVPATQPSSGWGKAVVLK